MGRKTPLAEAHRSAGAKLADFGGWEMPIIYSTIGDEHRATRERIGLFDVSHMGRVWFSGTGAAPLLDRLLTNLVGSLEPGKARYSLVLNEQGGVRDDVLVYRVDDRYLVVVNAGNRLKLLPWFEEERTKFDARMDDQTLDTGMIAVQGPRAVELVGTLIGASLADLATFGVRWGALDGEKLLISRTGYTGEDGVELIGSTSSIVALWDRLLDAGGGYGIARAGLGARDTLRIEAGMPLYGHELTEEIDPIQAGLGWAVKSRDKDFIGRSALMSRPTDRPVRVGIRLEGRRIAREGFPVRAANEPVGAVSSGTFSPTLEQSIAMAYVDPGCRSVGNRVDVDVRGTMVAGTVVPLPFYKRRGG